MTINQEIVIAEKAAPRLERIPVDGGPPERTKLTGAPITVGRGESAQLRIQSNRVSREHAVILLDGDRALVRDLGSTNGTFINGNRVEESVLSDGDVITFADAEFTFVSGDGGASPATRTQVLDAGQDTAALLEDSDAIIREVRRVQEMLTLRTIRTYLQPIVHLDDGQTLGYSTIGPGTDRGISIPGAETFLATVECTLIERLRHATRLVAAEEAACRFSPDTLLFMDVHYSEIGTNFLIQSIRSVHELLADRCRLAVRVPNPVAGNTPYFRELRSGLADMGIRVAFTAFAAGQAQVREHDHQPPDFVELDASLVRYIHRNPKQRAQVEAIAEVCREMSIEVIAAGVRSDSEAKVCQGIGCQYGHGALYGAPELVSVLAAKSGAQVA